MRNEGALALRNSTTSNMWLDVDEEKDDRQKLVDRYDNALLKYVYSLQKTLNSNQVDLREVGTIVDVLAAYRNNTKLDYLSSLIHPEQGKGAKIPSQMPVPTSSFQLKSSNLITTNSSGNAAICFNPFFLGTAGTESSFFVNNNAGLTGQASSNFFTATNILQNIPAVYNRYRVVSACLCIKYIGRLDIVQGVIGGAILYQTDVEKKAFGTVDAELARFGDFNIAQDAFYFQEHMTLNGLRTLYFPIDNTYEQYYDLGTEKTGFLMYAYIYGGVPASAAYKVDIYVNYECIPDPAFLNYIPVTASRYVGSCEETKREAVREVQKKPITDESEGRNGKSEESVSLWDSVLNVIGPVIPKLVDSVTGMIPGMKLAQSLYNIAASSTK